MRYLHAMTQAFLIQKFPHRFLNVPSPHQMGKCWHYFHFTAGRIEAQKSCPMPQEKRGHIHDPISLQSQITPAVARLWPIDSQPRVTGYLQELGLLQVDDGKRWQQLCCRVGLGCAAGSNCKTAAVVHFLPKGGIQVFWEPQLLQFLHVARPWQRTHHEVICQPKGIPRA